jgi:hypothetical protein
MFCEYMLSCYLFPFILLFSISSMFELHVVVAGIIMFNILELIMEFVPNYPTNRKTCRMRCKIVGPSEVGTVTPGLICDVKLNLP